VRYTAEVEIFELLCDNCYQEIFDDGSTKLTMAALAWWIEQPNATCIENLNKDMWLAKHPLYSQVGSGPTRVTAIVALYELLEVKK
jgi:hypothetical protein